MAEENNQNPTVVTPPTGTDPTPTAQGDQNNQPENLTIPKHRFDEVNNELKAAREALAAKEKAEKEARETQLKEQNKWKELAEQKEKELNETKTQIQQTKIDTAIERAAIKAGAVDSEAVLKLIDRSSIKTDEQGNILGADEAIKSLAEARSYLFGKGNNVTIGNPTNPSGGNSSIPQFTISQISDAKFYQEHREDILSAQKAGRIIDDRKQ